LTNFPILAKKPQKKKEKEKKKEANAPDTKAFLEETNAKKSPHYEETFSEIIIFRLHRSQKKKQKKRGVVFNHIAKILGKTIPKLFYFTL
jgi:hypothetical protein